MVFFVKKEKKKEKKNQKVNYTAAQNIWFMVKLAWTSKEKKVLVLGFLCAIFTVALELINLYVVPTILSAVERHVSIGELLGTIFSFVLMLAAVSGALAYVNENILYGRVTVRMELSNLINYKSMTTSYPNIHEDAFVKLRAKANECVSSNWVAGEAIWTTLTELFANLLGFVIYASLLTSLQPILFFVILFTAAVSYGIRNYLDEYAYRHKEEEETYVLHMRCADAYGRHLKWAKDIRIFGMRSSIEELYQKAEEAYIAFQSKAQNIYKWGQIADLFFTFFRNMVIYAYLIGMVVQNNLSISEFLLFFTAANTFSQWISNVLGNCNTLHKQSLELCQLREFLDYSEPFCFTEGKPLTPEKGKAYEIRLENVSFRYPELEYDILKHLNLTLHAGEKLAVVGLNGAGKSTLIKLLCGFLDPTEGRVLLNGTDIREFNRTDYYQMFSAVFQNFSILAETVAVNVAQDTKNIDRKRVAECLEKAGLREKIEALPNGYDTYLDTNVYFDATSFSGGETQRLMLARALYKDAPFIILDEPTAALDPIAESDMYEKYHEMTKEKSSVYISHRLASTKFCDRIILIADGGICEEGTHEELLELGGKYTQLYEMQSKYYKDGGNEDERSH